MSIEKDIKQKKFKNPYNKVTVNIMFTTGWLMNKYSKILKPFNLSEQQYNVLKILQESHPQPVTVNHIIKCMIDKMSNASRLVDKLVAKDLVKKVKSIYDLRSVNVLLTEKGLILVKELTIVINDFENSLTGLTIEEVDKLFLLLSKLRKDSK
jgi:DNA-binding MarR family transcriptional regulator